MAVKRLKPIQDTFLVKGSPASFGGDEILELGTCSRLEAEGCSRILTEFLVSDIQKLLGGNELKRATLHLMYAQGGNLPAEYEISCYNLFNPEWIRGNGHIWDVPGDEEGASWNYPKGIRSEDRWEGGMQPDAVYPVHYTSFSNYKLDRDIRIDITDWIGDVMVYDRFSLLLTFVNEDQMEERGARLCFYSSKTHTVYSPYLELVYDDSEIEEGPEADPFNLNIGVRNLKESYYPGERVRIDLSVRPEYPRRVFSTASLYDPVPEIVSGSLWGIRDEYTGEMWVPFDKDGTKISFDERGNYFILDTDLLEPERYYRLLFKVEASGSRKVYDSKNIFRVTRNEL